MIEKAKLSSKLTKTGPQDRLIAQAVRVYLGNQRKAKAKTKTRGEINKTTAKMYKQKGTGRARHGAYSAPIFVGGGIAFGPTGEQNYKRKMSKALGHLAFVSALTAKSRNIWTMDLTSKTKGTKLIVKELAKAELPTSGLLVVLGQKELEYGKYFRNLKGVSVTNSASVNTYEVVKSRQILFSQKGLEEIGEKYAN